MKNNMTSEQIIEAIKVLAEVVNANKGLFGSEWTAKEANNKIKELIKNYNEKTDRKNTSCVF